MNNQFPHLPDGTTAMAVLVVDPTTGESQEGFDYHNTVKIIGRCSDVDNVLRDTWDGPTPLYVFPAAPMQMQLRSTSANDSASGTGVRSVRVYYLSTGFAARELDIALNGTTPVLTAATDILRVNKMHARSVGSGQISAGAITLESVGGATIYSLIPIGRTFARQAIYTVPAGKFMRIEQWQISSGSAGNHFCQHTLVATTDDGELNPGVFLPKDEHGTQNGGEAVNYPFSIEDFPAGTDIKVGVISDSNAADVIAMTAIFGRLFPAAL